MEDLLKPRKLRCDHCGEVIETGLFSMVDHAYRCKAIWIEQATPDYQIIHYPKPSFTVIYPKLLPDINPTI